MGTSTQVGQIVQVRMNIYEFSTEDDRLILIGAFKKGQNQGLVNALEKMKAAGRRVVDIASVSKWACITFHGDDDQTSRKCGKEGGSDRLWREPSFNLPPERRLPMKHSWISFILCSVVVVTLASCEKAQNPTPAPVDKGSE
jgi:hypothetical protein